MAPEVLRGATADELTDIWALGVVLYEAATGRHPFVGATGFELCGAILRDRPEPLPGRLPAQLKFTIERCLEKDPRNRFQTADEVRLALERVQTPSVRTVPARWIASVVALVVLAVALGAAAMWRDGFGLASPTRVAPAASGRPAIAIMSFDVADASDTDSAWLSKGVPRMLMTGLAQTRGLEVVSSRRLVETARQVRAGDLDALDRAQAAEVARRSGAGAMIVGSIVRAGGEIRIDAQLEDLASGRVLVAESARGADVFSIVDQLANQIRSAAGLGDSGAVRKVADVSTASLSAYRLFAQGADAYDHVRTPDADRLLSEAVRIDPALQHRYNSKVPFERHWHGALTAEIALAAGDLEEAATAFAASVPAKRYWQGLSPYYPSVLINSPQWRDGAARVAKARGDWGEAIEIYRSLNAMSPSRKWSSLLEPRYLLETARLLEKRGDAIAARAEYERFLEHWKKADSDLPELAEARRAVARLK